MASTSDDLDDWEPPQTNKVSCSFVLMVLQTHTCNLGLVLGYFTELCNISSTAEVILIWLNDFEPLVECFHCEERKTTAIFQVSELSEVFFLPLSSQESERNKLPDLTSETLWPSLLVPDKHVTLSTSTLSVKRPVSHSRCCGRSTTQWRKAATASSSLAFSTFSNIRRVWSSANSFRKDKWVFG